MTVTPAAPAVPGADRVAVLTPSPLPALPLGRVPRGPEPVAPPSASSPPDGAAPPAPQQRRPEGEDGDGAAEWRAPHRSGQAHAPAPAPAKGREPRARPRPRARTGPGSSYDMTPLCAAARGTVSPGIASLCADKYGR
ncbi:hypothetical protein [Streptomyces sp. G-G2]|uniref:hypothetical protein n=1 Tax=Streptomyces sp. G-G2 TaxID=3046201 RepID=UPI0024B971CE|nr:hypothetical protein [Streptomyces sp. G-G2]MDJ0383095.1 hypothetical protein [Streptomyces sp. G-G2]